MKCQNCGKGEVVFHYSSNMNGNVTSMRLCSECAAKSGYDFGNIFDRGGLFNGFLPSNVRRGGFLPAADSVIQFGPAFPFLVQPGVGAQMVPDSYSCGRASSETSAGAIEVDEEMKKRRELYMLMRSAADNEDFEKAAEIRDQIKELEK